MCARDHNRSTALGHVMDTLPAYFISLMLIELFIHKLILVHSCSFILIHSQNFQYLRVEISSHGFLRPLKVYLQSFQSFGISLHNDQLQRSQIHNKAGVPESDSSFNQLWIQLGLQHLLWRTFSHRSHHTLTATGSWRESDVKADNFRKLHDESYESRLQPEVLRDFVDISVRQYESKKSGKSFDGNLFDFLAVSKLQNFLNDESSDHSHCFSLRSLQHHCHLHRHSSSFNIQRTRFNKIFEQQEQIILLLISFHKHAFQHNRNDDDILRLSPNSIIECIYHGVQQQTSQEIGRKSDQRGFNNSRQIVRLDWQLLHALPFQHFIISDRISILQRVSLLRNFCLLSNPQSTIFVVFTVEFHVDPVLHSLRFMDGDVFELDWTWRVKNCRFNSAIDECWENIKTIQKIKYYDATDESPNASNFMRRNVRLELEIIFQSHGWNFFIRHHFDSVLWCCTKLNPVFSLNRNVLWFAWEIKYSVFWMDEINLKISWGQ